MSKTMTSHSTIKSADRHHKTSQEYNIRRKGWLKFRKLIQCSFQPLLCWRVRWRVKNKNLNLHHCKRSTAAHRRINNFHAAINSTKSSSMTTRKWVSPTFRALRIMEISLSTGSRSISNLIWWNQAKSHLQSLQLQAKSHLKSLQLQTCLVLTWGLWWHHQPAETIIFKITYRVAVLPSCHRAV